jgi:hypothetical protein
MVYLSFVAEPVEITKSHGLVGYSQRIRQNFPRKGYPGIRIGLFIMTEGMCSVMSITDRFTCISSSIVCHLVFNSFYLKAKPRLSEREYISPP